MTHKGPISAQVTANITNKLEKQGIELYDIEYRREQNGFILRIFIDCAAGVDTDTCVAATRAVKDYLDNEAQLDYDYLEVSSPGIDRILKKDKEFIKYQGARVLVKTTQPVEGKKKTIGILVSSNPDTIIVEIDGQPQTISREIISMVRLHPEI